MKMHTRASNSRKPGRFNKLSRDRGESGNFGWRVVAMAVASVVFASVDQAKPKGTAAAVNDGSIQGARVTAGSATLRQNGPQTSITASNGAIINYTRFDIPAGNSVRFIEPSAHSRVLNRINSAEPSRIDGSLTSNGTVYLVNPAGVMFGAGSVINVGQLYAAAAHLSDDDFRHGVNRFTGATGTVVNGGSIQADAVHLVGLLVDNQGSIVAPGGVVTLIAGNEVLLGQANSSIFVHVDPTAVSPRLNSGAGDVYALALRSAGSIRARNIRLQAAGANREVQVSGTLDASNKTAGGKGGSVAVLGDKVTLTHATLDASGDAGGGKVMVGGDFHGQGPTPTATKTSVDAASTIKADALTSGDGGQVVVWAQKFTQFLGQISTLGGATGGNGGQVEVSGGVLDYRGTVDASAPKGNVGSLLLDPETIDVVADQSRASSDPTNTVLYAFDLQNNNADVTLEASKAIQFEYLFAPANGYSGRLQLKYSLTISAPLVVINGPTINVGVDPTKFFTDVPVRTSNLTIKADTLSSFFLNVTATGKLAISGLNGPVCNIVSPSGAFVFAPELNLAANWHTDLDTYTYLYTGHDNNKRPANLSGALPFITTKTLDNGKINDDGTPKAGDGTPQNPAFSEIPSQDGVIAIGRTVDSPKIVLTAPTTFSLGRGGVSFNGDIVGGNGNGKANSLTILANRDVGTLFGGSFPALGDLDHFPIVSFTGNIGTKTQPLGSFTIDTPGFISFAGASSQSVVARDSVTLGNASTRLTGADQGVVQHYFHPAANIASQNGLSITAGKDVTFHRDDFVAVQGTGGLNVRADSVKIGEISAPGDITIRAKDLVVYRREARSSINAIGASLNAKDDGPVVLSGGVIRFDVAALTSKGSGQTPRVIAKTVFGPGSNDVVVGQLSLSAEQLGTTIDIATLKGQIKAVLNLGNERGFSGGAFQLKTGPLAFANAVTLNNAGAPPLSPGEGFQRLSPAAVAGATRPEPTRTVTQPILSLAAKDDLKKLQINLKTLTTSELLEFLVGRAIYNDVPDVSMPTPADFQVTPNRLYSKLVPQLVAHYRAVYVQETVDPKTGKVTIQSLANQIHKSLSDAVEAFKKEYPGQTFDVAEFRRFVTHKPELLPARKSLEGMAKLFTDIENLGLTNREVKVSEDALVASVKPEEGISTEELKAVIRGKTTVASER